MLTAPPHRSWHETWTAAWNAYAGQLWGGVVVSIKAEESLTTRLALFPVRLYQRWISPVLPRSCRYYPSCSAYAVESIQVHGVLKGTILATWRLLRCNPLTRGGVDHVPEPGQWRYHHPHDVARFLAKD